MKKAFRLSIREFLEGTFLVRYMTSSKERNDFVAITLKSLTDNDEDFDKLIERLLYGSKIDVSEFIGKHLSSLPIGLRTHLLHDLIEMQKAWLSDHRESQKRHHSTMNDGTFLDSIDNNTCCNMYLSWKQGLLSPIELFQEIKKALDAGEIDSSLATKMMHITLLEGGYSETCSRQDFNDTRRFRCVVTGADLASVSKAQSSVDGSELEICTTQGQRVLVSADLASYSMSVPSTFHAPQFGSGLWWCHTGEGTELLLLLSAVGANRPVLLIGDSVVVDVGEGLTVEIDTVISVDISVSSLCSRSTDMGAGSDMSSVCILVEGRVISGSLDRSTRGLAECDGDSEIGGPENFRDPSSSGSGEDEDDSLTTRRQRLRPPALAALKRRYYAIFATIFRDSVVRAHAVASLQESILMDQRPTMILSASPCEAVVAGTNALLMMVKAQDAIHTSPSLFQNEPLKKELKSDVIAESDHDIDSPLDLSVYSKVESLTVDHERYLYSLDESASSEARLTVATAATHAIDSTITCLSYRSDIGVLVSADSHGTLCVWDLRGKCFFEVTGGTDMVECSPRASHLMLPPFSLAPTIYTSTASAGAPSYARIHDVDLSPSGQHIAVALWDRVLLVGVSFNFSLPSQPQLLSGASAENNRGEVSPKLYVRACLDIVEGQRARYGIRFNSDSEKIFVWRIMNLPLVSSDAASSAWLKDVQMDTASGHDSEDYLDDELYPHNSPLKSDRQGSPMVLGSSRRGLAVTSWQHRNVDSFEDRFGVCVSWVDLVRSAQSREADQLRGQGRNQYNRDRESDTWTEASDDIDSINLSPALASQLQLSSEEDFSTPLQATYPYQHSGDPRTDDGVYIPPPQRFRIVTSQSQNGSGGGRLSTNSANSSPGLLPGLPSSHPSKPGLIQSASSVINDESVLIDIARTQQSRCGLESLTLAPSTLNTNATPIMTVSSHSFGFTRSQGADSPMLFPGNFSASSNSMSTPKISTSEPQPASLDSPGAQSSSSEADSLEDQYCNYVFGNMSRGVFSRAIGCRYFREMCQYFTHESSDAYIFVTPLLAVLCACLEPAPLGLVAAALETTEEHIESAVRNELKGIVEVQDGSSRLIVPASRREDYGTEGALSMKRRRRETSEYENSRKYLLQWLSSTESDRAGREFWIDSAKGHNSLCALYLRNCGNKSVAMEHAWQDYLRTHGPTHLRRSSRTLRRLTTQIRKIDETANIRGTLPRQLGYICGLQEMYARRVGVYGRIPEELGELSQLRVLSMGNNQLCGPLPESLGRLRHLQRIVLHQNKLSGAVPESLGRLGCIVNLAGNAGLEHGDDVPPEERQGLLDIFHATKGARWAVKSYWATSEPVCNWYKVGVLSSHVHSIVMSSNGLDGMLPGGIGQLKQLRMIELATMPDLTGPIPRSLCGLTSLRRLCICRCALTGRIPEEIGQLEGLEELQLFGNKLSGAIPSSVGKLVNLKLLSLGEYTGGNDFASAPLPACLSSLVNLEALFLANCNLKGTLPTWIGNLKELRQLDLQRNNLCGLVPASIGDLTNLLYLNLKDNQYLCGALPVNALAKLTKLNRLSLVHCNFGNAQEAVNELQERLPRCKIWA